jgi:hypothetical protein
MIAICQPKKINRLPSQLLFRRKLFNDNFQGTDRGGIIEATADHSDIRGLVTAFHIFSVELPLS